MTPPMAEFLADVEVRDDSLSINGESIDIFHSDKLDQLPWQNLDIDVVLNAVVVLVIATVQKNILRVALNAFCFLNPLSLM